MLISTATDRDLLALVELEQSGFDPLQRWSLASWQAELNGADRLVIVDRHIEQTTSSIEVNAVASFRVVDETAELMRIIVAPMHRGHRTAERLMRQGIEWAEAMGANRMLLEVRDDNTPALSLYRRLGFTFIDRRRNYYPGHDAMVMELRLERSAPTPAMAWGGVC